MAQSRGVQQQILDRDLRAPARGWRARASPTTLTLRNSGMYFDTGSSRRNLPLLLQHHHGDRRDRLGHRVDAEDRARGHRRVRLEILHARGFEIGELAVARDGRDRAGDLAIGDELSQQRGRLAEPRGRQADRLRRRARRFLRRAVRPTQRRRHASTTPEPRGLRHRESTSTRSPTASSPCVDDPHVDPRRLRGRSSRFDTNLSASLPKRTLNFWQPLCGSGETSSVTVPARRRASGGQVRRRQVEIEIEVVAKQRQRLAVGDELGDV